MTLYHGTNVDFMNIDLTKSFPYKDFGRGFYVTEFLMQARKMVAFQITRYQEGYITAKELARMLKYRKLSNQYYFGTGRAINCLKRVK